MAMREAYRSVDTGDLGCLVEEGRKKFILLDRPNQKVKRAYREQDWVREDEHRPLSPQAIGRILFGAEKDLLVAIQDPQGRKMSWDMMDNADRSVYMNAESEHALVRSLHKAMNKVLKPLGE